MPSAADSKQATGQLNMVRPMCCITRNNHRVDDEFLEFSSWVKPKKIVKRQVMTSTHDRKARPMHL